MKKAILILVLILSSGILASTIFSQQATVPNFPENCYRPKKTEYHQCFTLLYEENLKRSKNKKQKNKPPTETIQKIEADRLANEERRQQENALIRQKLDAAQARNISNKGRKYRVTFGRVPEPTE
ncbi:MAG: hypothetical protein HQM13_23800 [SAR324 cluster bacterium]|nr:hypothetical protein [SAR324 cluster bacterium]